jgi:hypothetical protein
MPDGPNRGEDTKQPIATFARPQLISAEAYRALAKRTVTINAGIFFAGLAVALFVYFRFSLPPTIPRHDRAGQPVEPESLESYLFSFLVLQLVGGVLIPLWSWALPPVSDRNMSPQLARLILAIFTILEVAFCLLTICRAIAVATNLIG